MKYCYKCRTIWNEKRQPGAKETCVKCLQDLHVCLNCRFYDEHKTDKCMIDNVDPVLDKERSNFCEEFQFIDRVLSPDSNKVDKAKQNWENLFKKNDK